MPSIRLPESEANDMRRFYEEELDKTMQRLQHIKSVLDQLGGSSPSIDIKIKGSTSSSAPRAEASAAPVKTRKKSKQRPGRKSIWEKIIMGRFEAVNRPMTYEELTDEVMSFSKLPTSKRLSTKQAIMNVAFRLRTRDKMLDTFSAGQREKYLAPMSWFESKGKIKGDFLSKIKASAPAKKAAPKAKAKVTARAKAKATAPVKAAPVKAAAKPKVAAESAKKSSPARAKTKTKAKGTKTTRAARKPAARKVAPKATPKAAAPAATSTDTKS